MILKFKQFINESIKTEYQLNHLNNKQKRDYFEERLRDFIHSDFGDENIKFRYNDKGYKTEYYPFTEYEFDLCPLNILNKYIEICIQYGLGIPYECLNSLNTKQKELFLDSCAKNARQSYVKLNIFKLFNDKQMYNYIVNSVKNKRHLSNLQFEYLSDKFKKFYLDKCIQFKTIISNTEFSWIKSDKEKEYYINYYINKCLEKGGELNSELINTLSDKQKLIYYTKQVEKGEKNIGTSHNLQTGVIKEIDWNQIELDKLKKKLQI